MHSQIRRLSAVAVCLAGAVRLAQAQGTPAGIPQEIVAEVKTPESLPAGTYTQVGRWTGLQLGHQVGLTVDDSDATGGKAWGANADLNSTAGAMIFGPYFHVAAGDYVAFFRLRVAGEVGDEGIATVDACVGRGTLQLSARELGPDDFNGERYVQAPLAFHSVDGELECRVQWQASTSIRVDCVTLFRRDGPPVESSTPVVAQPMPTGSPNHLRYAPPHPPFAGIFPRSSRPSTTLTVCDVRGKPVDVQQLAVSVQGLVNRSTPRVYCDITAEDPYWLAWLRKRGRVKSVVSVADPIALVKRFRAVIKGVIVTDPALPATRNVATMMAGVMDGGVVSPRLASRLGLPVLADLRGRWATSVEAYQWAYDTLWDKMNHYVAACLYPPDPGLRDYLIQHRIPIIWLPGRIDGAKPYARPEAEMRLMESVLARMPANVPIMGYSWAGENIGMGEGPGVGLMAEFGKYLVGSSGLTNVSVHSGYPSPPLKQPTAPRLTLQRNKVYYSFIISDGDNLPVLTTFNWPQLWRDPVRKSFAKGWTISPSSAILLPDIVDWYYKGATSKDTLIAAVSGVGYTYPQQYGKRYTEPGKVFDDFLGQTDRYMKAMDLRSINPSGVGPKDIARYAERLPGIKAIFADYGRGASSYAEATTVTSNNVPVFHGVTGWEPQGNRAQQIAAIVAQIEGISPAAKPAFLHVFICNWFFDMPALREVARRLGPNYIPVLPDQLAALCREDMEKKQLYVQVPTTIGGIEGRRTVYSAPIRNVSSKPLSLKIAVHSSSGTMSVAPAKVVLRPAQELDLVVSGQPTGSQVTLEIDGPFGRRTQSSAMFLTRRSEIVGELPPANARYLAVFEAEGLPHFTGAAVADPAASGGRVRSAEKGADKPGHIVYGPYRATPPGRYTAFFRIKRTGAGDGLLCTLDANAAGGAKALKERPVDASELPIGEWRTFPLTFDFPGGALETRAVWTGAASMSIDRVELYEVGR